MAGEVHLEAPGDVSGDLLIVSLVVGGKDQLADSERKHTTENVGYLIF